MKAKKDKSIVSDTIYNFLVREQETNLDPAKGRVNRERWWYQLGEAMSSGGYEQRRRLLIVIKAAHEYGKGTSQYGKEHG
jgi:hypothetical protein